MNRTKTTRRPVGHGIRSADAQHIPEPDADALRTAHVQTARLAAFCNAAAGDLLGIVMYGGDPGQHGDHGGCPLVTVNLPQLNEPSIAEVWTSTLPVTYHRAEGIHFAMNDEVLFGSLQLDESLNQPLDVATYAGYRRLLRRTRDLGYPHLLRVWNYFPRINLESDGLERYQRFCVGRHQAMVEGLLDFPRSLPAGTAIGTASGRLIIYFFAARKAAMHVESPLQMNAFEYPRAYGPRSPSFARATLRPSCFGSQLFIAGTASVVGHANRHIGDVSLQTRQVLHNLTALVRHTEQLHGLTPGQMDRQAFFKVYLRHPKHRSAIADILKQNLPAGTQVLYLQGDICRKELLVEIEGILSHLTHDQHHGAVTLARSDSRPAMAQYEQPHSLTRV